MNRFRWTLSLFLLFATCQVSLANGTPDPSRENAFLLPANPPRVEIAAPGFTETSAKWGFQDLKKVLPVTGGDDLSLTAINWSDDINIDIASNGDIYVAVGHNREVAGSRSIDVYRSQDGGTSFQLFGQITSPAGGYVYLENMDVVEGTQDRVFVTYIHKDSSSYAHVRVAYEDLAAASATWTIRTVIAGTNITHSGADLADDSLLFSSYYLYVVSSGREGFGTGDGDDIWFSRSSDYGDTWSTPYQIASMTAGDHLVYDEPEIAVGQGGLVHVVFRHTERLQDLFDDGVRYMKATNYAGSSTDWGSHVSLYGTSDGYDSKIRDLVASPTNGVVSLFTRETTTSTKVWTSTNNGDFWALSAKDALPFWTVRAAYDPTGDRIVASGPILDGAVYRAAFVAASVTDMEAWTAPVSLSQYEPYYQAVPATDPTRSGRVALAWSGSLIGMNDTSVCFDAEWKADDGYPNYEPGFPVAIPSDSGLLFQFRTPPAVVDIDGNTYGEIVFGDRDGQIHVIDHLGTSPAGWPVDIGAMAWGAPVAIGDLNGDGQMAIVAGNTTGQVFAYDPSGALFPGFPADLGTGADTFVSIGTVGGPYPRWIFAASGNRIARISYRGEVIFKAGTLDGHYVGPAAIGDLDDDGLAEVVVAYLSTGGVGGVHRYHGDLSCCTTNRTLTGLSVSDAVTLADLDLDGDLEICVPTNQGKMVVMHDDLTDMVGFPYDDGTGYPLTAAAISQILGTSQPELLFGSILGYAHIVYWTGVEQSSYPSPVGDGWYLDGGPIAVGLQGHANWITMGSRDGQIHTRRNVGAISAEGWPKDIGDKVEVTPARADLDNDGRTELVYLGNNSLHVVDVGPPSGNHSWSMYGNDPQRTGCYQCSVDLATAAPLDGPTRVDFRITSANPSIGPLSFAANLPAPGVLELTIFDVRGRRVRLVSRQSVNAGLHALAFDGRDGRGQLLARGQYFAQLEVRGDGFREKTVRRFVLVD